MIKLLAVSTLPLKLKRKFFLSTLSLIISESLSFRQVNQVASVKSVQKNGFSQTNSKAALKRFTISRHVAMTFGLLLIPDQVADIDLINPFLNY